MTNGITLDQIIQSITTVGFPIVAYLLVYWDLRRKIEDLKEAIQDLKGTIRASSSG